MVILFHNLRAPRRVKLNRLKRDHQVGTRVSVACHFVDRTNVQDDPKTVHDQSLRSTKVA